MLKKKASVEVQFNWVFVMIVGALILVFFFGVVQKQRELSQAKISNAVLTNIESIATGASVSRGTVQKVALPNIGIDFSCTDECLCTYSIEDLQREYADKIIFAPARLDASELVLWTLDWKAPFRVNNIVYATTANDKYFIVYQDIKDPLLKLVNRSMPAEANYELLPYSQYTQAQNENYNSAKFVFINVIPPDNLALHSSFSRADANAVYLNSAGDAIFYDKSSSRRLEFTKKISSYFGEPMIFGAIFASDSGMYECNAASSLKRMSKILDIYIMRASYLQSMNDKSSFCIKGYTTIYLESLKGASDTASSSIEYFKAISSAVSSLNSQNEDLLRSSCPMLY